jgi:hypothetical protein
VIAREVRRAVVIAALSLSLASCRGAFPMPSADDLATWSRTPLAPDPALARLAVQGEHGPCRGELGPDVPLTILLQDRRTAATAAFFVTAPGHFGSCLISAGGSGGGGSTNVVPSLVGVVTVEEEGSGIADDVTTHTLGGLASKDVRTVRVGLPDGTEVTASVDNGYWLSWWPGQLSAVRISALDSSGVIIAILEPGPLDWVAREPGQ